MTMAGVDLRRKCGAKTTEENGDRWERAGSQDLEFYFRDAEEGGTPSPSGICLGTVGTKKRPSNAKDTRLKLFHGGDAQPQLAQPQLAQPQLSQPQPTRQLRPTRVMTKAAGSEGTQHNPTFATTPTTYSREIADVPFYGRKSHKQHLEVRFRCVFRLYSCPVSMLAANRLFDNLTLQI